MKASGLDVSTAIRLFLRSVLENGGMPFALPRANLETMTAIADAKSGKTTAVTLDTL